MRRRTIITVIVLIAALLNGCAAPPPATIIPGMEQTLAVRTMVAMQGIAFFTTPTPTCIPVPALSDSPSESQQTQYTQIPTNTPVPSLTPFNFAVSLLQGSNGCSNMAEFVKDVTVEDYSQFKPNQLFTKIWEVKNTGTCIWTTNYALVFTYGDRLNGMSPKMLNQAVKPGETVDLSIDLVAPKQSSIYQGNWMLQDENGNQFGTGLAAKDFFWVSITVGSSTGLDNIFGSGCCKGGG